MINLVWVQSREEEMEKLLTGRPAPGFRLPDLNGREVALEVLRGRVVVVNFWSAECPHAERADRELNSLVNDPEWQGQVVLLAIASNANEPAEMLAEASREREISCVLLDPEQVVADQYAAQTTPHIFVIDGDGLLCYQGPLNDFTFRRREPTRFYVREALEALFRGKPVAQAEAEPYGCTIVRRV